MTAELWSTIESDQHDVRLVVCDMDGTLLDGEGRLPEGFWELIETLTERGIVFAPASGRQYATLAQMFPHEAITTYISDNGTRVVQDGEIISLSPIVRATAERAVQNVRAAAVHRDLGVIAGGVRRAYVERPDDRFVDLAATYNIDIEVVDDLLEVEDDFLKMATYDFDGVEDIIYDLFPGEWGDDQVILSGTNWIDIITSRASKGTAVADLQKHLGVTPAQTAVFGDYLNDLEMIQSAELSFAMENGHSDLKNAARYIAPKHTEDGFMTVMRRLLDL